MNIILGATGQIGSLVIDKLLDNKEPIKAVVRNEAKATALKEKGVSVAVADYFDEDALKFALKEGDTVFLLTPENPESKDIIKDSAAILQNYHNALKESNIKRIVCLSSMGAQHPKGTGNLEVSYMLEHSFTDLNIEQVFIRPAYYYSNWIGYLDIIRNNGMLPTFFPPELKIPMIAPIDVATFIADVIIGKVKSKRVVEITGPEEYSSNDISEIFGKILDKTVTSMEIPENEWQSTLSQSGFSVLGANNLALMTKAVISGKTQAEFDMLHHKTSFFEYVNHILTIVK